MSDGKILALLGGPASGKSTYLGALADALEDGRLAQLELVGLPGDARALEHLTEPLLDGHYPQRTKAGQRLDIDAHLRAHPAPNSAAAPVDVQLRVGDYDGEEVERLFRDRARGWSDEWRARASADGLLLFLRPRAIRPLVRTGGGDQLSEAERWQYLAGVLDTQTARPTPGRPPSIEDSPEAAFGPGELLDEEIPAPPPARPGQPVHIPTVLAVIELLQFMRHARGLAPGERPAPGTMRVAILVAAWDAASEWHKRGASVYVGETMPLLVDYLWSNFHERDVLCFGLSSTGGDLNDPDYRARYLDDGARGYATWRAGTSNVERSTDLSVPLRWALFGDPALVAQDPARP